MAIKSNSIKGVLLYLSIILFLIPVLDTFILPLSPGLIGSFGHCGTVQPHEPCAFEMINGSFPLLTNLNS